MKTEPSQGPYSITDPSCWGASWLCWVNDSDGALAAQAFGYSCDECVSRAQAIKNALESLVTTTEVQCDQEASSRSPAPSCDVLEALERLVEIIDKAGLLNLRNGVQLGQTSWYVKASDRMDYARAVLARSATNQDSVVNLG